MWGEMLEAGLGERGAAYGSPGLKVAGQEELSLDLPPVLRWKLLRWGCGFLLCPCREWDHLPPEEQGAEEKKRTHWGQK